MYQTTSLTILPGDFQAAITQTMERLAALGLQVKRSFDLQAARRSHTSCTCPKHGTDQCNCQMVVFLVYQTDKQPVTLIIHGHDCETELAIVDQPNQQYDPDLMAIIRLAIT